MFVIQFFSVYVCEFLLDCVFMLDSIFPDCFICNMTLDYLIKYKRSYIQRVPYDGYEYIML